MSRQCIDVNHKYNESNQHKSILKLLTRETKLKQLEIVQFFIVLKADRLTGERDERFQRGLPSKSKIHFRINHTTVFLLFAGGKWSKSFAGEYFSGKGEKFSGRLGQDVPKVFNIALSFTANNCKRSIM